MSFRSRTHTKPVVPVRRSASLTRSNPATGNSSLTRPYGVNYANPYQSTSNYLNPYHTNLDSSSSSYSPRNSGYFDYGSGSTAMNSGKRRESYGSNTSLNTLMYSNPSQAAYAYKSPYKDRDRYGNGSSSYTSAYGSRYVSPYSTYENGITTAGLNFHVGAPSASTNLMSNSKGGLSTSNASLNHYLNTPTTTTSHVVRSSSLRDQERKSRSRNRKKAAASQTPTQQQRSLSVSSVHSDIGYEVRCLFG